MKCTMTASSKGAHGNTLEFSPHVILGFLSSCNDLRTVADGVSRSLVTGLWWPELAAGLAFAWTAGRIRFTLNYEQGDPSKV